MSNKEGGDIESNIIKIQEDGKILLNFTSYGLDFIGDVFDLRLLETMQPLSLIDESPSQQEQPIQKKYTKQNTTIHFVFDALLNIDASMTKHVELRWLQRNGVYVLMKRLKEKNNKRIYQEAILHTLAFHCLKYFHLTNSIPEIYDIVQLNNEIIFTMQAFPEAITLSAFLVKHLKKDNFLCFIEILAQIALYMLPLQSVLYFNHRDLKSDNILVDENKPIKHVLKFGTKTIIVQSRSRAILIDFGFSCVGYEIGGGNLLSGGPSLPPMDACPKDGRDIFHILSSLYSFEVFRRNLHPLITKLCKRWMNFDGTNYTGEIVQKAADETWIYRITSGTCFSAPNCSPLMILADIAEHFPTIVTLS